MADKKQAIDFILRQEDSTLSGKITDIPGDAGGTTRFGLTAKYHPTLVAAGFFSPLVRMPLAQMLAESEYDVEYATPLMVAEIADQAVATALLSFAVNEEGAGNRGKAVQMLQDACRALGAEIAEDGAMGPETLAAINACGPARLLELYCEDQQAHYEAIAAADSTQQKFLAGWTNRVKAVAALAV